MTLPNLRDVNCEKIFKRAKDYYLEKDYVKALEKIEDLFFVVQGNDRVSVNVVQGNIFKELAIETEDTDVKVTYMLGTVECFSVASSLSTIAVIALLNLAEQIGSALYYKKSVAKAKEALSHVSLQDQELAKREEKALKSMIEYSEIRIAESKTRVASSVENGEENVRDSKENAETKKSDIDFVKGLKLYWEGLKVETKRNFMKVSTMELTSYVEGICGAEGRDAMNQVLNFARENRKWRFWMCRSCSKKFSSPEECKDHLEQKHGAAYRPKSTKHMPQKISKVWARKIFVGGWEPVDAAAAVGMIKNQHEDVKAFVYKNGWCEDWPLAVDEERSKLLKEIKLLLVSFCDHKVLSCSIRDWVMHFLVNHLEKLEVSKQTLTECHLVESPQSICFLECRELNQILDFLKNIKCKRDDATDVVCRAVDSFCGRTRVKEKLDFDPEFSSLLLDKRLLQCKIARFDDEGIINVSDPTVHYAKAHAQGDDIISWLFENSSANDSILFPSPIRAHNLDIWVAVLKVIQFTCRTFGKKYGKKWQLLEYDAALTDAKNLCISEDEKRRNLQEDQWNKYASLLCNRCEENLSRDAGKSVTTNIFLCAVRDVFKGASNPTFDIHNCIDVIREHKDLSDDIVLKSIDLLKLAVTNKVPLIDAKLLLIENSRVNLLNNLTRLSVFDYRSYILRPMREFMLDGIIYMANKAKLAAAEADLLSENKEDQENKLPAKKKINKSNKRTSISMSSPSPKTAEEGSNETEDTLSNMESNGKEAAAEAEFLLKEGKKSQPKKKINKSNKRTSMSMSSHPNKTTEHEPSVNLEPGVNSPSLETAEKDSMETEDNLASEWGRSDMSSNTNNHEEATKDMQSMPGEGLQSEHLESAHGEAATRYSSALDMTLKALLNIKVLQEDLVQNRQLFHGNLDEQVPCALQDLFSAFFSEQITERGVYSYLLSNLLAALEEVHVMVCADKYKLPSNAAEVVVTIFEFCHCWKRPDGESLVTRLFTLEKYEKMRCRKCRRKPNYPEQSSYGIVMAADSIRDLKYAFGNIKFESILKVIRMEDKMLCDIKTGGCGKTNFVHHTISRCPPIFTIVLEWEKNETEKEISETTKALEWEIDISRLYEGLEPNFKYRVVSMIGCGEEGEYICMAYKKNRWVSLRHEPLAEEVVGNWNRVVSLCGQRKVRPEILFYEAVQRPLCS